MEEPKTDLWAWRQHTVEQLVERPDGVRRETMQEEKGRPAWPGPPIHAAQFATARTACGRGAYGFTWELWPPAEPGDACKKCARALRDLDAGEPAPRR